MQLGWYRFLKSVEKSDKNTDILRNFRIFAWKIIHFDNLLLWLFSPTFLLPKMGSFIFSSWIVLCNDSKRQVHCVVKLWKIDKIAKSDIEVSNRNFHRKGNRHFWVNNLSFDYCTYNKGQSMQVWTAIDFNIWFYKVLKCSRTKKNTLYTNF